MRCKQSLVYFIVLSVLIIFIYGCEQNLYGQAIISSPGSNCTNRGSLFFCVDSADNCASSSYNNSVQMPYSCAFGLGGSPTLAPIQKPSQRAIALPQGPTGDAVLDSPILAGANNKCCRYETPPSFSLPNLQILQNQVFNVNLSNYSSDAQGDPMSFFISAQSNDVACSINGNILTLTPRFGWSGTTSCSIGANDSFMVTISTFSISISAPLPYLDNLEDKSIPEDSDFGTLIYEDIESRCHNGQFGVEYDSGDYSLDVVEGDMYIAYLHQNYFDSGKQIIINCSNVSNHFNLTILPVDDPLVCSQQNISIDEDSPEGTRGLGDFCTNVDDDPVTFERIVHSDDSKVRCRQGTDSSLFDYVPAENFFGESSCIIGIQEHKYGGEIEDYNITAMFFVESINDFPLFFNTSFEALKDSDWTIVMINETYTDIEGNDVRCIDVNTTDELKVDCECFFDSRIRFKPAPKFIGNADCIFNFSEKVDETYSLLFFQHFSFNISNTSNNSSNETSYNSPAYLLQNSFKAPMNSHGWFVDLPRIIYDLENDNITFNEVIISNPLEVECIIINEQMMEFNPDTGFFGNSSCIVNLKESFASPPYSRYWNETLYFEITNNPPSLIEVENVTVRVNDTLLLQLNASDPNGYVLRFGTNATIGVLNSSSGLFIFNSSGYLPQHYTFLFNVSNGGQLDEITIKIFLVNYSTQPMVFSNLKPDETIYSTNCYNSDSPRANTTYCMVNASVDVQSDNLINWCWYNLSPYNYSRWLGDVPDQVNVSGTTILRSGNARNGTLEAIAFFTGDGNFDGYGGQPFMNFCRDIYGQISGVAFPMIRIDANPPYALPNVPYNEEHVKGVSQLTMRSKYNDTVEFSASYCLYDEKHVTYNNCTDYTPIDNTSSGQINISIGNYTLWPDCIPRCLTHNATFYWNTTNIPISFAKIRTKIADKAGLVNYSWSNDIEIDNIPPGRINNFIVIPSNALKTFNLSWKIPHNDNESTFNHNYTGYGNNWNQEVYRRLNFSNVTTGKQNITLSFSALYSMEASKDFAFVQIGSFDYYYTFNYSNLTNLTVHTGSSGGILESNVTIPEGIISGPQPVTLRLFFTSNSNTSAEDSHSEYFGFSMDNLKIMNQVTGQTLFYDEFEYSCMGNNDCNDWYGDRYFHNYTLFDHWKTSRYKGIVNQSFRVGTEIGSVNGYLIAYGLNPIVTEEEFNNADLNPTSFCFNSLKYPSGELTNCSFYNFYITPNITYYFAIRAFDEVANLGPFSSFMVKSPYIDMSVDSLVCTKEGLPCENISLNTIFKYDNLTVKANITNKGNYRERVRVDLMEQGIIMGQEFVTLNPDETREITFNWEVFSGGKPWMTNIKIQTVLNNDLNNNNNNITLRIPIWALSQFYSINFLGNSTHPYPANIGSVNTSEFYVWVKIEVNDIYTQFYYYYLIKNTLNPKIFNISKTKDVLTEYSSFTNDSISNYTLTFNPFQAIDYWGHEEWWWRLNNTLSGVFNITISAGKYDDTILTSRVINVTSYNWSG